MIGGLRGLLLLLLTLFLSLRLLYVEDDYF